MAKESSDFLIWVAFIGFWLLSFFVSRSFGFGYGLSLALALGGAIIGSVLAVGLARAIFAEIEAAKRRKERP